MIFRFLGGNRNRAAVARVFGAVVDASRQPVLYTDYGVPDTVEGRFESVAAHLIVLLRKLRRMPPPSEDFAQELVEHWFAWLDNGLREMGVGDLTVPKRMKSFVEAFYGRAHAYDAALDSGDEEQLARSLARNMIGVAGENAPASETALALARYIRACEEALAGRDLRQILAEGPGYPEPAPASGSSDGRGRSD